MSFSFYGELKDFTASLLQAAFLTLSRAAIQISIDVHIEIGFARM